MRKKISGLGLMLFVLFSVGAVRAAEMQVDVGFFYDQLSPYGEWVAMQPYGWVWCPSNVGFGWRPYTDGYWAYSDYGWTFVSSVDWGWACYHYGRWGFDNDYGWYWVPGTDWGPAWVAWRWGGGYCGWAPLPPQVGWSVSVGIEWGGFDIDRGFGGNAWCFVDAARLTDPNLNQYVINSARNVTLIRETKNITNYNIVNNRIVNNSVDVGQVEKLTGRPVPRYKIVESQAEKGHAPRLKGEQIEVFRPQISPRKTTVEPKNVSPAERGVNAQEMAKRHKKEQEQLNSHYDGKANELKKQHEQEKANPPKDVSQEELKKRHAEESKALEEQKKKDAQVMENRQKREKQQAKGTEPKQSQPTKQQGKKKKD